VRKLKDPKLRSEYADEEAIKDLHTKLDDLAELNVFELSKNPLNYKMNAYFGEDIRPTES
jgi:hypothetical protein